MTPDLASIIRAEVERRIAAGQTEYRVATDAGVTQSMLAKFRNGSGATLATASKLCRSLGLELRGER